MKTESDCMDAKSNVTAVRDQAIVQEPYVFIDKYLGVPCHSILGQQNCEGLYELPDGDSWERANMDWLGDSVTFMSVDDVHQAIREFIAKQQSVS